MVLRKSIIFIFISLLAVSSWAQDNPQPIEDTIENFDSIVDDGNPAEDLFEDFETDSENQAGKAMPDKEDEVVAEDPLPNLGEDTNEETLDEETSEEFFSSEEPILSPAEELEALEDEEMPLIRQRNKAVVKPDRRRRYIQHPNAAKGLIRIDKDRTYYYKSDESERKFSVSVLGGMYEPTELANPDSDSFTFSNSYDETNIPMFLINYEKKLFSKIESLKYYFGGGFYFAQGNGQFECGTGSLPTCPPETPQEEFSLFVFPLSAGLNYYLRIFDNQWIVPYGGGGLTGFVFGERRDDDLNPDLGARWGLSPAVHFQGGLAIPLSSGPRAFIDLDREYGINEMFVSLEYKNFIGLSDTFDFSSDFIGGGLYLVY